MYKVSNTASVAGGLIGNAPVRWLLLAGIAIFTGTSCQKPGTDDPEIIVTFPPEFSVDLYEQRDSATGAPVFGLWVESMASFDCGNYRIVAATKVSGEAIRVELKEVSTPDTCLGQPGPARAFLPIGPLPPGVYPFVLSLGAAIVNEGTLTVSTGHYELSMPGAQGVDFQQRVLESIPDHYVWGFALAPAEADLPVADQFVAGLKTATSEPALAPGYYGYFTVGGTGQYFFHKSIDPKAQHRPFLRRLSGSPDAIRGLLQTYRTDPAHPLTLRCLSTYGEW